MGAPRKFDEETRARAIRMYEDRLRESGATKLGSRRHVGELLDIPPATLRNWVEAGDRAKVPAPAKDQVAGIDVSEARSLRRENAELRRANEILKTASAFFAQAELDPMPRSLS